MTAVNPEFAIIHLLIFDHPDGQHQQRFGRWNTRKIRARLRTKYESEQGVFTVDKVERMVKKIQEKKLFDQDFVPFTKRLLFYSDDRDADPLMKEVFSFCRAKHPDINLEFSRDRLSYDLEDKNGG